MKTRADFEELVLTECLVTRWPHVRTQALCSTAWALFIRQIRAVANTLNHENSPLGAGTLENSFFLQLDDVGDRGWSSCIPFAPEFEILRRRHLVLLSHGYPLTLPAATPARNHADSPGYEAAHAQVCARALRLL